MIKIQSIAPLYCKAYKLLLLFLLPISVYSQTDIRVKVQLQNTLNDQVPVIFDLVKPISGDTLTFRMPRVVPGTYAISDFGRFISDLKAFDASGKLIEVFQSDQNSWEIVSMGRLSKIQYLVSDTWDSTLTENEIFNPAGTNIEQNQNFVINPSGFVGYINGATSVSYELIIEKPKGIFGATALSALYVDGDKDVYQTTSYHELIDSPLLYGRLDTVSINVGGAQVLVAVYAEKNSITSAFLGRQISGILQAQKAYLGGTLPIKKYAFLFYFFKDLNENQNYGALEHNLSSMYFMPEIDTATLAPEIRSIAAHEFFHIFTPLTLKSEEIAYFDYHDPKMSKHLWLYEGVVEYFAHHVQVQHGITTTEEYLEELSQKLYIADRFNQNLPITELSSNCLTIYHDEYENVYYKGALIALCLDLEIQFKTQGKLSLMSLLRKLTEKYGPNKPFKDDELIDELVNPSYPELRSFFESYVEGAEELPLRRCLEYLGVYYKQNVKQKQITIGGIQLGVHPLTQRLFVASTEEINSFGRLMGYQLNDQIISINGREMTLSNYESVFGEVFSDMGEGDKLVILVERENAKGKKIRKRLKAKMMMVDVEVRHLIEAKKQPTEAQVKFFERYFNP
jgi:predicted metalloprotease with PDZ domain